VTTDGKHQVDHTDEVTGTVYYRNLETGDLEFIGKNGDWVKA
jgi:hypothetical protein